MTLPAEHPAVSHALICRPGPGSSPAGLPLANGLLGALVWQRDGALIVSLDRTDVWDMTPIPEFAGPDYTNDALADLVEANDMAAIAARFEAPYYRPSPTKLPIGRLRIVIDVSDRAFGLALDTATVSVGDDVRVAVDALSTVGVVHGQGPCPTIVVEAPDYGVDPTGPRPDPSPISNGGPQDLGYQRPVVLSEHAASGYVQMLPDGRAFAVRVEWRDEAVGWRALWTVALADDAAAAQRNAATLIAQMWLTSHATQMTAHEAWWEARWREAWLTLPDAAIERQWALDAYKLIAAGRRDAPPIALQGPWTWDDGRLPPWKGDYHHDLNTQMTYWPTLTGNRFDAHRGFLDWLWNTRDACRAWTHAFFQCEGLNVPMTADLANRQIGGWAPYTHQASTGAWLAHHFVQHWRYTGDRDFLVARALPYLGEVCTFIDHVTRHPQGRRLRLNTSPEIGNNGREAWLPSWSNYDLALFRAALGDAAELSTIRGETDAAVRWHAVLSELPDLALDDEGGFAVARGKSFDASHRHFSHALAIHPLRSIAPDDPRVAATCARLDAFGTSMWMGYSFAWAAGLNAYARDGEKAAEMLRLFARGFTATNSFHTNGDISGEGLTAFPFNAFTLEGNCAAMAATQDMLLQSRGEAIHVFPAVPADWMRIAFTGLRAEGRVTVSARRDDALVEVELRADHDTLCTVDVAGLHPRRVDLVAQVPSRYTVELA